MAGRVKQRGARTIDYSYDAVGRVTNETWVNGNYTATYEYDAAGRLTLAYDPFSSYSYGYDAANRPTSVDNANTPGVPHVVLTYAYDVYNNRLHVQDSLGGNLSYGYDADHNLTQIGLYLNGHPTPNLTFGYDAANRLTSISRYISGGDTITSTFSYDNANHLTGITHTDTTTTTTLATYTYGYDAASRLTSYSGPDGSLTYGYDNNDQLTSVSGARSESFSYDANGNRTMSGYTTTHNELTSDGTYNYTYDNNGNLLTQTQISTGTVTNYTWDYRNRLTEAQVKSSGGTVLSTETFTYDVNNNRIGMLVNGTQTWTMFDKTSNVFMDFNSSGQLTERYIANPRDLNQFYARVSGSGTTNWYLTDNLNSVRQIIDTSGNVLDQLTYSSFGSIVTETNAANGDRFKFTGGAYDSVTGQYQFGARYYGPSDGRFVSQDWLGFRAGDANLYRYVFNSPIDASDPSGLKATVFTYPSYLWSSTGGVSIIFSSGAIYNILPGGILIPVVRIPPYYWTQNTKITYNSGVINAFRSNGQGEVTVISIKLSGGGIPGPIQIDEAHLEILDITPGEPVKILGLPVPGTGGK